MAYDSDYQAAVKKVYLGLESRLRGKAPTPAQLHRRLHDLKLYGESIPSLATLRKWISEFCWEDDWREYQSEAYGNGPSPDTFEEITDPDTGEIISVHSSADKKAEAKRAAFDHEEKFADHLASESAKFQSLDSDELTRNLIRELGAIGASAQLIREQALPVLMARLSTNPESFTVAEILRTVELGIKTSTSFADRLITVLAKQADLQQNQQGMVLQLMALLGVTPHGLQELIRLQRAGQLKSADQARKVLDTGVVPETHDQLESLDERIMARSRERSESLEQDGL